MANNPDKKAVINPVINKPVSIIDMLLISVRETPKIIGIDNKNENLIAFSLLIPNNVAVEIVAPLLEIPGNSYLLLGPDKLLKFRLSFSKR